MLSSLLLAWMLRSAVKPTVLWVSEPVRPGETVIVFGEGFEGIRSVSMSQGSLKQSVTPLQVSNRCLKVVTPNQFHAGPFAMDLNGLELKVNRPKIVWSQTPGTANPVPGGTIRLFGTGLSWSNLSTSAWFSGGGKKIQLPAKAPDRFSLNLQIPSTVPPGSYQLTVQTETASVPLAIRVASPAPKPKTVVSVAEFGATGQDGLNDNGAVRQAIAEVVKRGGGVVTFPRGRFALSAGIEVPPKVTLRGAGMNETALCWPDTETPPFALIKGSHDFGVEDLTLYAMNHHHGIASDLGEDAGGNVRIQRVRMRLNPYRGHITPEKVASRFAEQQKFSTGGPDCLRLGGLNLVVTNCDLIGGGRSIYLSGAKNSVVAKNRFANGRWGWYCLSGSDGLIFEDNLLTSRDLMATGGGINCLDGAQISQNVYYARNQITECPGWDREAMTSDAGGGAYFGRIASANGNTVTLPADPKGNGRNWKRAGLFVFDGKGQGQLRQIQQIKGRAVTLNEPFTIPLDSTSIISITMIQRNYYFIDNLFDEAGVAIQLYGTSVGHIASGNTSRNTDGFHNFGMNYYNGIEPSWFVQWLNNRIDQGNVYGGGHDQTVSMGEAHLGVFGLPPRVEPKVPVTLACVMRGNELTSNAHLALGGQPGGPNADFAYVQDAVVEKNTVRNASCGLLRSEKGVTGAVIRDNDFSGCPLGEVTQDPIDQARTKRLHTMVDRINQTGKPILALPFERDFRDATNGGYDAVAEGPNARIVADPERKTCLELKNESRLVIQNSESLNLDSFTLSLWVKTEPGQGHYGLFMKRNANVSAPLVVGMQGTMPFFEANDVQGKWSFHTNAKAVLQSAKWQHLVVVKQGGKGVWIYLNGDVVAELKNELAVSTNTLPFVIGWDAWGGSANKPSWFQGRISDLRLWPRALSEAEVKSL